ncbi:hypothetical protein Salat_2905800 [Sesamum alatum]|uniref:Uncharacterized protein n=1 Tax=Sesamum alatum TaxID=300844 RepID=A0AAE1XJJ3_9LAMI|nr:hypothetical protein Salat_2905800 [Sesamum alatum]
MTRARPSAAVRTMVNYTSVPPPSRPGQDQYLYTKKLREHYETFAFLISCPELFWERWNNTVFAPSEFWVAVASELPLAKAYKKYGEPNWLALRAIFTPPPENMIGPAPGEVIEVNDDN